MLKCYLLTVVQSAAWNCSTMVSRAGSMYQMLAKMKEMMERLANSSSLLGHVTGCRAVIGHLATLHTTPISTSSSQAVRCAHCAAQKSRQPLR